MPKYTCTVKFDNKALEIIRLPQICFPNNWQTKKQRQYLLLQAKLGKTVRNEILSYK